MNIFKGSAKIFQLAAVACALALLPARAGAVASASYSHYLKALLLEREGNFGAALEEYKNTIALDPNAKYVYQNAIKIALRVGKVDEAMEWAQYLVKAEPQKAENWTLFGSISWAKGDIPKAAEAYEKAIALDATEKNALYQYANMVGPSNPQKAVELFKKYAAAVPEEAGETYYQIGLIYFDLNKPKEALEYLKNSVKKAPSLVPARYALAHVYEVQNDTTSALATYLDAEGLDPKNAALTARVGEIYMAGNKEAEAETYFTKTLQIDKNNAGANFWMSLIAERRRDFASALRYIQDSAAYENDPTLWLRASYYLTQTGKYKDAIKLLEAGSKKWPANYEMGYFLAMGLDDTGDTARGVDLLKGILAAKPDYPDARMQYASMLEKLGRMEEAEQQFRALLDKSPNDPVILNYLGYSLADRGLKLDEAFKLISRAVELAPDNGAYLDSLGWVYFKQGKNAEALEQLKKAVRLTVDDETVWEHLGEAYLAADNNEGAWAALKMAQAMKPQWEVPAAKLKPVEKALSQERLGALTLAHLANVHAGYNTFNAMGKVTARAMGKELSFDAILHFRKPDEFNVDLMGPMFTPVCKMKMVIDLNGAKSTSVECGDNDATGGIADLAQQVSWVLWGYYSGELLKAPARWNAEEYSRKAIEFPDRTLNLTAGSSRLASIEFKEQPGLTVNFADWSRFKGRLIPQTLVFETKNLTLTFRFTKWNGVLEKDTVPIP